MNRCQLVKSFLESGVQRADALIEAGDAFSTCGITVILEIDKSQYHLIQPGHCVARMMNVRQEITGNQREIGSTLWSYELWALLISLRNIRKINVRQKYR